MKQSDHLTVLILSILLGLWTAYSPLTAQTPSGVEKGSITLTTSKAVGETILLAIDAVGEVTIEGVKEAPQTGQFPSRRYTLTEQTVTIRGDVTFLRANSQDLSAISLTGCTHLTELYCLGNNLTELDLSHCPKLQTLWCNNNKLTSLDLSHSPELVGVWCYNNALTEINLSNSRALELLHCYWNKLERLDLSHCLKLQKLECYQNNIQALDLSACGEIESIQCNHNKLTRLTFKGDNPKLKVVTCHDNMLRSLSLGVAPALEGIYCYNNQIEEITFQDSPHLMAVIIQNNQIRGEKMTKLVQSLPDRTDELFDGSFVVHSTEATRLGDGNACLKSDVALAKPKKWNVYYYGEGYDYIPYEGEDPTEDVCYSYANRISPQPNSGMGFRGGNFYGPCFLLTPAEGFADYTIKAIEPCLTFATDTVTREGEIFVANKTTGEILYNKKVMLHFGYNYLPLDSTITISKTDSLLIGYNVWCDAFAQDLGIDYDTPPHAQGCYLQEGVQGFVDLSTGRGAQNWAMDIVLQAPDGVSAVSRGKVDLFQTSSFYATADKPVEAYFVLHNLGSKDISSLTYTISGVSQTPIEKRVEWQLEKGRRDTIRIEVLPEASGEMTLQIKEINDEPNFFASQEAHCGLLLYDKPKGMPRREHLLECLMGEWAPFVSYGVEEVKETLAAFEGTDTKINFCTYHIGKSDPFATPETNLYSLYVNSKAAPNLALNRIPYDISRVTYACEGHTIERIKQLEQETYSPYRFSLRLSETDDPMVFNARVDVEELQPVHVEDLRITVSIFEDQVTPHNQVNKPEGYIHRNVFVKSVTDFLGDPILFDKDKTFTQRYTITLDSLYSGDVKNIRVLAFISRDLSNSSLFSKSVLDSRMLSYGEWTSVERPATTSTDRYQVSVDHSCLVIEGGEYDRVEVWNMQGMQCNPCELATGAYIVRIEHLGAYYIYKLMVQ